MPNEQQTILVVDDNPTNLAILSDYLTKSGYTVLLKKDGEKALKLIERKKPDIILLDIMMPIMDGFETCRRLKQRDDTKDIPIIFMTALTETQNKVKGFELGAVDYITKPFQQEEVLARVKTHLTIRHLQKDLKLQNMKLQEALNREKRIIEELRLNLSLSLPHELRTPLNSILGFSELLKDLSKNSDLEKISSYGTAIYESGKHLHRLVENALLYANLKLLKFTSDKYKNVERECAIRAKPSIVTVAQKCAADAERTQDLVLDLVDSLIMVSSKNFEKILTELIGNAFKFSTPGTPVTIKSSINGNLFLLSISDNGRGMTKQQIETIGAFMQFNRQIYEQQGSGLGLIVACLLVQLEGGMISINSTENKGTTISMVFHRSIQPIDSEPEEPPCWFEQKELEADVHKKCTTNITGYLPLESYSEEKQTESIRNTYKIMVISDNSKNRLIISNLLTAIGFEVLEASDTHLGIHKAIENKPHIIFLDMDMLDSDDIEDIQKLRQSRGFAHLKLIAVTGKTLDSINKTGLTQWVDDVLFAPISKKDILDSMKTNLMIKWITATPE